MILKWSVYDTRKKAVLAAFSDKRDADDWREEKLEEEEILDLSRYIVEEDQRDIEIIFGDQYYTLVEEVEHELRIVEELVSRTREEVGDLRTSKGTNEIMALAGRWQSLIVADTIRSLANLVHRVTDLLER